MIDILPSMLVLLAAIVLVTAYMDVCALLNAAEDVKQVSRKYILSMETKGYLDDEDRNSLIEELTDLNVTGIDLTGTTMSDVGYGNPIQLSISCNLPVEQLNTSSGDMLSFFFADGVMSIHEDRMSTAKH